MNNFTSFIWVEARSINRLVFLHPLPKYLTKRSVRLNNPVIDKVLLFGYPHLFVQARSLFLLVGVTTSICQKQVSGIVRATQPKCWARALDLLASLVQHAVAASQG